MDKHTLKVKQTKFIDLLKNIVTSVTSNPTKYKSNHKMSSSQFKGLVKEGDYFSVKSISKKSEYYQISICITIDTEFYKSSSIFTSTKTLFSFMEKLEIETKLEIEREKYNPYISDITKSVNKTVVRDDKLNELLK